MDLRTRVKRTGGPIPDLGSATDLELASHRRVAFIAHVGIGSFAVYKNDATGLTRLDTGPAIEPRSLRVIGEQITWRNGGTPHTAAFAPA